MWDKAREARALVFSVKSCFKFDLGSDDSTIQYSEPRIEVTVAGSGLSYKDASFWADAFSSSHSFPSGVTWR